jgi:hypothetical protein
MVMTGNSSATHLNGAGSAAMSAGVPAPDESIAYLWKSDLLPGLDNGRMQWLWEHRPLQAYYELDYTHGNRPDIFLPGRHDPG